MGKCRSKCITFLKMDKKDRKIVGYLYGDNGEKEPLYLSEKAEKELEEINKEVDKMLKPLDDALKPFGYGAKDVIWANGQIYVLDKKTGEKLFLV